MIKTEVLTRLETPLAYTGELLPNQTLHLPEKDTLAVGIQQEIITQIEDIPLQPAAALDLLADVVTDATDPQSIKEVYAQTAARRIANSQWWNKLGDELVRHDLPEAVEPTLQLRSAHIFNQKAADGSLNPKNVAVYECGPGQQDQLNDQELADMQDTLTTIMQLSGGALLSNKIRPPVIVMVEGVPLSFKEHVTGDREFGGFQTDNITTINLSYLRRMAAEHGADFSTLLSNTLVHEILGHRLEDTTEGTGKYFKKHFEYSAEQIPGSLYKLVHTRILPKAEAAADSRPVREYGYTSSHEDGAASMDTTVAHAMGWQSETNKIPWFAGKLDPHRAELSRAFLVNTAQWAGDSASEEGIKTQLTPTAEGRLVPAKTYELQTLSPQEVQEQIKQDIALHMRVYTTRQKLTYASQSQLVG